MLSYEWEDLTPEEQSNYYQYVFDSAIYTEMGRRAGYLIATADFEQAGTISLFCTVIRSLMAGGKTMEEALNQIADEHKELPQKPKPKTSTITAIKEDVAREALAKGQELMRQMRDAMNKSAEMLGS